MPVLLRDPQQILSQHELPGQRGMTRVVGSAPSNVERLDAAATLFLSDELETARVILRDLLAAIFGAIGDRLKVEIKVPYDAGGLT